MPTTRTRLRRSLLGGLLALTDLWDGSHPVVDWLGKRRYLSIPIASG